MKKPHIGRSSKIWSRRNFVKAGVCAAAGLGGAFVFQGFREDPVRAAEMKAPLKGYTAEHWGMVIDLDKLHESANFEQIAEACHSFHNVPEVPDLKAEVKWIWLEDFEHSFVELESHYMSRSIREMELPVLCNHCESPACVRVCPTKATFKRTDGIVVMDYHRCVGCRFCMAACPFGARSFNFYDPRLYLEEIHPAFPTRTIGVVEKCTFCVERLEQGQQPLCAEASNGAIVFGDLADPNSPVRQILDRRFAIRRRVELGTGPSVYYVFQGGE